MKTGRLALALMLALALLASIIPGCVPTVEAVNYVAVVPRTLHAGERETVSFTLLGPNGEPAAGKIEVALVQGSARIASASGWVNGKGRVEFEIPAWAPRGEYELYVKGTGFEDKTTVSVDKSLLAREDENGLHWGGGEVKPLRRASRSVGIEATAYAALALLKHGDKFNASRAAKWLVSQRNAFGGFNSTQDTVIALQALTEHCSQAQAEVNLHIKVVAGGEEKEVQITRENFDVLQVVQVPINEEVRISAEGEGEAIIQVVKRFNLLRVEKEGEQILKLKVDYDATEVEVNDLVRISVELEFNPPVPMEAGMVVLDVSVPTGFTPVERSLQDGVEKEEQIKRYDIAGRKVIFYLENLLPGDRLSFSFQVKALHPVKAKGVSSKAYSYYKPRLAERPSAPSSWS